MSRLDPTSAELARLRRRLHDTTLQTLEYIASGGFLGENADIEELMRMAAREATELREALEGVVAGDDQTLVAGLRRVVAQARAHAPHDIQLSVGPSDGSVTGLRAIDVAGAVREALTNARKHSGASTVVVYCEEQQGGALVTVKDDGVGVEPERLQPRLGLRHSVFERMRKLGGEATLQSRPGEGVLLRLHMPPDDEPADDELPAGGFSGDEPPADGAGR